MQPMDILQHAIIPSPCGMGWNNMQGDETPNWFKPLRSAWNRFLKIAISALTILMSAAPIRADEPAKNVSTAVGAETSARNSVPIRYGAGHLLIIPAKVCGQDTQLILDTGCGVNVISQNLLEKYSCKVTGVHSGQRMSGQKLSMKIASLPSLQIATCEQKHVPVAQWKLDEILGSDPEFKGIEGFVSLDFFKSTPFTIDYHQKKLFIETETSLKERLDHGTAVPVRVIRRNGVETSISLSISFSKGESARVEVDTGSGALILNEKYMKILGINPNDAGVRTVKGKDETGHAYVRYFTKLPGEAFLSSAHKFHQEAPAAQFQQIIYDGLVGDSFLHNFVVTYDLSHKRMIFSE
jgi:hypothetical protein